MDRDTLIPALRSLRRLVWGVSALVGLALTGFALAQPDGGDTRKRQGPPHQPAPFVAQPDVDVILGRPDLRGVTALVLSHRRDVEVHWRHGPQGSPMDTHHVLRLVKGDPKPLVLTDLAPHRAYRYTLSDADGHPLASGHFRTALPAGKTFGFTVSADTHLDQNTDPALYERALGQARAAAPDFHIDLGDTFMVDKHANRVAAAQQYLQQRHYFGQLGVPLFLVLGNHDGEDRKLLRSGTESLAVFANQLRKRHFPNPEPDGFYSGNSQPDRHAGPLQDYYAWTWGDALFVVLNPYWHGSAKRGEERWDLTLGEPQYRWLRDTLERSRARHKLVFVHQLVGGADRQGRGGAEAVPYGEWGGLNADGSPGFAQQRPGWEEPIHTLLVRTGVNLVLHGHDHLYAYQQRDGIVYLEVPQPGHPGDRHEGDAYGYREGVIRGDAGILKVLVSPDQLNVHYLSAARPGQVLHAFHVTPRTP
ncbi:metallophosphoesterase family protein [Inhella gelatinilytica]|uniref:Metallophosphoesterase n=1 Tax=Inhella gelatinilytica TaxID=2795030 RepID=A0A931NE70_9BURK|nr:metallophosphoesterase [Inhella gelatinilytica]MBH9553847.1 metallophosphoesterase [Inhella gelatinilytica]